jgi:hypothetical protein
MLTEVEYLMGTLVPCISTFVFFTLVFGFVIIWRWFGHRERMAQIQQGFVPSDQGPEMGNGRDSRKLLGRGLGLVALGLALLIGLYPFGFVVAEPWPLRFGPWMVIGLIPFFIGLALLITYYVSRQKHGPQETEGPHREEASE